jgi:hypothetical protein
MSEVDLHCGQSVAGTMSWPQRSVVVTHRRHLEDTMTIGKLAATTFVTVGLAISSSAYAANVPGGNGSTGNPVSNDPAKIQSGETLKAHAMPYCTAKRTHHCRHHHHKTM